MSPGGGHIGEEGIFERMASPENLFVAWWEFRCGKRAKSDVQVFEFALEDSIFTLHEELASGAWWHGPYEPFHITDPKPRHIHKATVRDRLLHHAVFRVLYPIFDRAFVHDSYSCRVGKGTHAAVRQLENFARKMSGNNRRNFWAIKCDIRRFFDSVDHCILLGLIVRKVSDERAMTLIGRILDSFHKSPFVGLPLGNVTSQLFANIYLNELDRFVKHELKIHFYLRYCDDFLILDYDPARLLGFKSRIAAFLTDRLRLVLHPDKVALRTHAQGIDFLGYVVRPRHTVLRTGTKRRLFRNITAENAASYLGMLDHCDGHELAERAKKMLSTGL